jgi:RimK family alpha-L-glutamate ligase
MARVIIAHRPGSVLPGAPLERFEEELASRGAEVNKVDIRRITEKEPGDIVFIYNSAYRLHKKRVDRLGLPVFNIPIVYGKELQYKQLKTAGVRIPKYQVIDKNANLQRVIEDLGVPVITKPIVGTGGRGVQLHMNERELRRSLNHKRVIAQKYIKEAAAGDIRALVIDGEVVASLWRTPRRGRVASNFHSGGQPSQYNMTQEEKDMAVAAAAALGLSVSGVDIVPTTRGPYVFEANSLPDLMHMEKVAGIDAIPAFCDAILKSAKA